MLHLVGLLSSHLQNVTKSICCWFVRISVRIWLACNNTVSYRILSNPIRTSFCRFLRQKKKNVSSRFQSAPVLQPPLANKADSEYTCTVPYFTLRLCIGSPMTVVYCPKRLNSVVVVDRKKVFHFGVTPNAGPSGCAF